MSSQSDSCQNRNRLLTVPEVAELTGLAVGTVYHLIGEKRIPVVHISRRCVRFRLADLEAWFDRLSEIPPVANR